MDKELTKLANDIFSKSYKLMSSDNIPDEKTRLEISLMLIKTIMNISMNDGKTQIKLFDEAEKLGVHILKTHFYSPIPVVNQLSSKIWQKKDSIGIKWNTELSLSLLDSLKDYSDELKLIVESNIVDLVNTPFGHHDAALYYTMIRYLKPRKIIEVGSGYSTKIASLASQKNETTNITCIDPYPPEFLNENIPCLHKLIKKPVQDIPIELFQELDKNDILFIDSTHVSKIGSDVNYLFLEVLPSLKTGVVIHVHDIFLPQELPQNWVRDLHLFWNEQYLLNAFLIGNSDFEVLIGNRYMGLHHSDELKKFFYYEPAGGGSFWMRRIH